jgi:hypothetical protein
MSLQATSHLMDICRQTIIFEDMSSLAECLQAIRLDLEVNVVRIKNRLDLSYNAKLSAGYRDVSINITLAGSQTLAMGLEMHVCEVQLILLPMYQLKVSSSKPWPNFVIIYPTIL